MGKRIGHTNAGWDGARAWAGRALRRMSVCVRIWQSGVNDRQEAATRVKSAAPDANEGLRTFVVLGDARAGWRDAGTPCNVPASTCTYLDANERGWRDEAPRAGTSSSTHGQ
ncbi:hypothetical protein C8R45DRAFT_939622 [Mycena sanguinolenta]|nr:hypothetical protein C8R45DRAFT_939622 [Mycena sanguinolenta]